ncbi:MAG: polysaccharide biosynthesis/export family protein [Pseudomonadota bacterium]
MQPPDSTSILRSGDIRISPLDIINVSVFGVEELDGRYQVDHYGRVKMPLVDTVDAKGFTALEMATVLEQKLEESFLQNADVTVIIQESLGEQVTIEGSVKKPGMYSVQGQVTLLQVVALGGGPSETANPRRIVVFREIEGQRQAASFDLIAIRNGELEDPVIFGNDIVVVDGSEARKTYGELLRSLPLMAFFLAF